MTNLSSLDYLKDVAESTVTSVPSRPRSVYTTLSYQTDESNFQRNNGDYQFCEGPLLDTWSCALSSVSATEPPYSQLPLWRPSRFVKSPLQPSTYYPNNESCAYSDWQDQDPLEPSAGAVVATQHGTMSIPLHGKIRVDMTIDRAIRVINFRTKVVMSLSASGSSSALLHPNGRVYQYGSRVEILAQDIRNNNKYAKMWYKGISFTSEQCALVYLVDSAGTRTTTDTFSDMSTDFSLNVFYNESRHGPSYQPEAMNLLQNAQYFVCEKGIQNWIINNVRISQTNDGLLRIARNSNKYQIRCSATNGSATITTPFLHTTASLGQAPHLFVRRGERRMHYDGRLFIVRNAGHSAGFDARNMLKVF